MCCRRRYQQPQVIPSSLSANIPGRRRGGCCAAKRQRRLEALAALNYNTAFKSDASSTDANTFKAIASNRYYQEIQHRRPMAAIIIGAVAGAMKVKEMRKERKQKKALEEWEQGQVAEYRQKALEGEEARERRARGLGGTSSSGRRRSESLEREGEEVPPPRYEDVVDKREARGREGEKSSLGNAGYA